MSIPTTKTWLSPFLFITYLAVSITGILMLFHLRFPGLNAIHEWVGLAFVIAGVLHLCLNWAKFKSYFTIQHHSKKAVWGTIIGLVLILVTALWIPSIKQHKPFGGYQQQSSNSLFGNQYQGRGK